MCKNFIAKGFFGGENWLIILVIDDFFKIYVVFLFFVYKQIVNKFLVIYSQKTGFANRYGGYGGGFQQYLNS